MISLRALVVLSILVLGTLASSAHALLGGGGSKRTDCFIEFDGLTQTGIVRGKPLVDCEDGASCDGDGVVNNSCEFNLAACAFVTDPELPECSPQALIAYQKNNKNLPLPALGTREQTCAEFTTLTVPVTPPRKRTRVTLAGVGIVNPKRDVNRILLHCSESVRPQQCDDNPLGGPKQVNLRILNSVGGQTCGQDLDNGVTGDSHNFPNVAGGVTKACLTNCDNVSDSVCDALASTGKDTINGIYFGAPLPLIAVGTPVCVVLRFNDTQTVNGTVNVATGEIPLVNVHLFADIYVTSDPGNICPRCSGSAFGSRGKCVGGRRSGASCTVGGEVTLAGDPYTLASDCLPSGNPQGTITIDLPLTSGTSSLDGPAPCGNAAAGCQTSNFNADDQCQSGTCTGDCSGTADSKGGKNQYCCSGSGRPCYPTASNTGIGRIERIGHPVVPLPAWDTDKDTYPKTGTECGTLAAVFCEPRTTSNLVDCVSAGLPGPGAVLLGGNDCWIGNNGKTCE